MSVLTNYDRTFVCANEGGTQGPLGRLKVKMKTNKALNSAFVSGVQSVCVFVFVCVYSFLYILNTEYQNHSTNTMRIFLGSEDNLAGPHNFKALFVG